MAPKSKRPALFPPVEDSPNLLILVTALGGFQALSDREWVILMWAVRQLRKERGE